MCLNIVHFFWTTSIPLNPLKKLKIILVENKLRYNFFSNVIGCPAEWVFCSYIPWENDLLSTVFHSVEGVKSILFTYTCSWRNIHPCSTVSVSLVKNTLKCIFSKCQLKFDITHVVQVEISREILKGLEDANSINYWKVCNKHCPLKLTYKCPDTVLSTLLLLHLKMVTLFFSVLIYSFGVCKSDFLRAFSFLLIFN